MALANNDLVNLLKNRLPKKLEDYLGGDYQAVAAHSSSIIIAANQATADMFGYSLEEIIGKNAWCLFPSKSAPVLMQNLMAKSENAYTVTAIRKDRTEFDVELKGHDFEIDGDPIRIVLLREVG